MDWTFVNIKFQRLYDVFIVFMSIIFSNNAHASLYSKLKFWLIWEAGIIIIIIIKMVNKKYQLKYCYCSPSNICQYLNQYRWHSDYFFFKCNLTKQLFLRLIYIYKIIIVMLNVHFYNVSFLNPIIKNKLMLILYTSS